MSKLSFKDVLLKEKPLQVVGVINAYAAILADSVGYNALYLSGAGVANASYGLPDLAMTTVDNLLEDVSRITDRVDKPLLVDIDTGFGGAFNIARTIKSMIKAGASAVHIEDQQSQKRCGHRPNKALVSSEEMSDRIKAAVDARYDKNFGIMARTDAYSVEGVDSAIERALRYIEAGADMIFAEAMHDLDEYRKFVDSVDVPVLANITEFGKTPLFGLDQLNSVGISMVLYPLSAFRAMSQAALDVYKSIRATGTQKDQIDKMQTREDLYKYLDYYSYEKKLDQLFKS